MLRKHYGYLISETKVTQNSLKSLPTCRFWSTLRRWSAGPVARLSPTKRCALLGPRLAEVFPTVTSWLGRLGSHRSHGSPSLLRWAQCRVVFAIILSFASWSNQRSHSAGEEGAAGITEIGLGCGFRCCSRFYWVWSFPSRPIIGWSQIWFLGWSVVKQYATGLCLHGSVSLFHFGTLMLCRWSPVAAWEMEEPLLRRQVQHLDWNI